ncbi:MAG: hypothetical protein QOE90_2946 [Thermoplasmata archaeon]|jgi:hypothetical protein|nr:hypothetical protein [Thermoplasmata archaeon]
MPRSEPRPFATLGLALLIALAVAGCAQQQGTPSESTHGSNNTTIFGNDTRTTPLSNATPGNASSLLDQTMP